MCHPAYHYQDYAEADQLKGGIHRHPCRLLDLVLSSTLLCTTVPGGLSLTQKPPLGTAAQPGVFLVFRARANQSKASREMGVAHSKGAATLCLGQCCLWAPRAWQ